MFNKQSSKLRNITMITVLGLLGLVLVGSFVSPAIGGASNPLMIPHIDPHSLADKIPHIDPNGVGEDNGNGWGNIWSNGHGNGLDDTTSKIPHTDPN